MNTRLLTILFLIIACGNLKAELPYESDHKHSFVVTGGLKKNDHFNDNYQNSFSFNYSFQNKISVGISYRDFAGRFAVYEGAGLADHTGYLNNDEYNEQSSNNEKVYKYPDRTYYSLYAQIKPLNLLQIEAPISFSLFVAVQDVSESKNPLEFIGIPDVSEGKIFVGNVHIYKKFNLNKKESLLPIISVGYRDIAYVSNKRLGKIGASLIYSNILNKSQSVHIAPQIYRFNKKNEFSIQVGIMHGFGK